MLAETAREANIPYIMSGASNDTIETPASPRKTRRSALRRARRQDLRRSIKRTAMPGSAPWC
jgi:hypothetical protein